MGRIIGIDLGTTNSLAAVFMDGEVKLIPNAFGDYLTPSVVSIDDDGGVHVGKVAKERLITYPDRTASVFKRGMGADRKWKLGKEKFSAEELSSFVLKQLKADAEAFLGEPVEEAIISVPAYFGDTARNATREAGLLAGLKVDRIINEPSAAALACSMEDDKTEARYLVFDFGGGTLDVSLVDYFDNVIQITAVSGNKNLGGSDFDREIAKYYCKQKGITYDALDESARQNIIRSAETVKIELTVKEEADMVVSTTKGQDSLTISRKDMIKVIYPGLQRTTRPIMDVLRDAKLSPNALDAVIMVGGSSRMQVVQQYIQYTLKNVDIKVMNPDEMIAVGVGIYAGIVERNDDIKDIVLTDICPFSLGTQTHNEANSGMAYMTVIIPRNSVLPISRKQRFVTVADNQTLVRLGVYQGEEMYAEDNAKLGEMMLSVPPAPKGKESVSVTFTYDINGILSAEAICNSTGEKVSKVFYNGVETNDKSTLERANKIKEITLAAAEDEENTLLLEKAKRIYTQVSEDVKEPIKLFVTEFEKALSVGDRYKIHEVRRRFETIIERAEKEFVQEIVEDDSVDAFTEWLDGVGKQDDDDWISLLEAGDKPN